MKQDRDAVPQSAVEAQLARILADHAFQRAPRIARLLDYLVAEELRGEGERLKGYTVGVEALDKPADFDPSHDAGVRVETGRLRRMLDEFYRENPHEQVHLSVPKGGYRPAFEWLDVNPQQALEGYAEPAAGPAIAVVGFSGDAANASLAQDVVSEVRMELFRYREYQLVDVDVSSAPGNLMRYCREELMCEFMLRGRVRSPGVVSCSLTDLHQGRVIWVQQYELQQDGEIAELARRLVLPLAKPSGIMPVAAFQKRYGRSPGDWNAADCILRWHFYRLRDRTEPNHAALRQQVRRILGEDPWFGLGYVIYATLTLDELIHGLNPRGDAAATLGRARYLIDQAMAADGGNSALAHYAQAQVQYFSADMAGFFSSIERTLALHPHNPDLQHHCGMFLCCAGDVEHGLELLRSADLLHNSGLGYRLAYLVLDLVDVLDVGGVSLFETTYIPSRSLVAQVVGALLYNKAGQSEQASKLLGRTSADRETLLALVDLWIKDPGLNQVLRQQMTQLLDSKKIVPISGSPNNPS